MYGTVGGADNTITYRCANPADAADVARRLRLWETGLIRRDYRASVFTGRH
jgi:hypothetical protein